MAAGDQSGEGPRPLRRLFLGRAVALAAAALVLGGAALGASAATRPPETLATSGPQSTDIQLPTLSVDAPLYSIAIDTTGYQAELDECDWVRMDLTAAAPIVGAHNYCGGGVVLGMQPGDTVLLTGEGLDGTYVVTEIRDAVAGGSASRATAGMTVAAILQTCYWGDGDDVRLVGLVPAA
jgi:hypothetical protein